MSQTQLRLVACPKCGARIPQEFDTSGHAFCGNCGYVLTSLMSKIDSGQSHNSRRTHSTMNSQNTVLRISELTTRWVSFAKASNQTEANFALSLSEVTRVVLQLKLPKEIALSACELCKAAFERRLTRGKTITLTSVSAVYAACRLCMIPITIKEMAEELKLPSSKLARVVGPLAKELKLNFPIIGIQSYVSKLLGSLSLGPEDRTTRVAKRFMSHRVLEEVVNGRNPVAMSCAIVYLASIVAGTPKTQRQICSVGHVTETTVRLACRIIERACPDLLIREKV